MDGREIGLYVVTIFGMTLLVTAQLIQYFSR